MGDFESNGTRYGPRGLLWAAIGALVIGAGTFLFDGASAGREALKEVTRHERVLERIDMNIVEIMWHQGIKPISREEAAKQVEAKKSTEKKP